MPSGDTLTLQRFFPKNFELVSKWNLFGTYPNYLLLTHTDTKVEKFFSSPDLYSEGDRPNSSPVKNAENGPRLN